MTRNQFNAQLAQYKLEEFTGPIGTELSYGEGCIESCLPYLKVTGHAEKKDYYQGYNLYDMAAITGCGQWNTTVATGSSWGTVSTYGSGYGVELAPSCALWSYGTMWLGASVPIVAGGTYYISYRIFLNSSDAKTNMAHALVNKRITDLPTWTHASVPAQGSWQKIKVAVTVPSDWVGDVVYLSLQPVGTSTQNSNYHIYVRDVMITYNNPTDIYEPFVRDMSQYQQVSYIYNSSSARAYLNTGVLAKSSLIMDVDITPLENTGSSLLGYYNGENDCYRLFNYSGTAYFDCGGNQQGGGKRIYGGSFPANYRNRIEVGNLYIKDVNAGTTLASGTATGSFTKSSYIYLNYCNSSMVPSTARWHRVKIYDGSKNNIIRNLIPCYRKSDGMVGMLDTINCIFCAPVTNVKYSKSSNRTNSILQKPQKIVSLGGNDTNSSSIVMTYENDTRLQSLPSSITTNKSLYYTEANQADYLEINYETKKVLYYKWNDIATITKDNTFSISGSNIHISNILLSNHATQSKGYFTHGAVFPYNSGDTGIYIGNNSKSVQWSNILAALRLDTIAEFKVWLDKQVKNGTPVQIVYGLSTPEIYDFTENFGHLLKFQVHDGSNNTIGIYSSGADGITSYNGVNLKYLKHV